MLVLVLVATFQVAFVDAVRTITIPDVAVSTNNPSDNPDKPIEDRRPTKQKISKTQKMKDLKDLKIPGNVSNSTHTDIRLLSINTWHEGNMVFGGFEMLANVIIAANPHVVVLQEVYNYHGPFYMHLQSALAAKGKMYYGAHGAGDLALLSSWPINKIELVVGNTNHTIVTNSTIVAYHLHAPWPLVVCAVHLDGHHYAPVMPRGYHPNAFIGNRYKELEKPVTDSQTILKEEEASGRGPAIRAFLSWVQSLDASTPVVIAGDFNECSHLDWTPSTADEHDHHGVSIAWRNSLMLSNAGFQDSWREMYPDVNSYPGATWPSEAHGLGNTGWAPKADERDRIDFVYHNSGIRTINAGLVESPIYYVKGKLAHASSLDHFPLAYLGLPWPSDHKGLYVEFNITESQPRRVAPTRNVSAGAQKTSQSRHLRSHP